MRADSLDSFCEGTGKGEKKKEKKKKEEGKDKLDIYTPEYIGKIGKKKGVAAYRLVKQIGLHIRDVWVGGEQPVGA